MLTEGMKRYQRLAEKFEKRWVNGVVRGLKDMPAAVLAGEGAPNFWEEFCVQVRRDAPVLPVYRSILKSRFGGSGYFMEQIDLVGMWLRTPAANEIIADKKWHDLETIVPHVKYIDIVRYMVVHCLPQAAASFESAWILESTKAR